MKNKNQITQTYFWPLLVPCQLISKVSCISKLLLLRQGNAFLHEGEGEGSRNLLNNIVLFATFQIILKTITFISVCVFLLSLY